MQYGVCPQNVVALRIAPDDASEMSSQVLYGEHFKILEGRKKWSRIRLSYDGYEGWVRNIQILKIPEKEFEALDGAQNLKYASEIISHICINNHMLMPVLLGSVVTSTKSLEHTFEGNAMEGILPKSKLVDVALLYLKAPYLRGGRTPFGIDSSGFVQQVYRINGYQLKREAEEQAKQGEALSFIEESEPGDLAFFDNSEGIINHVGIILEDNYIIHCFGEVRIDRLDHTGIFNTDNKLYSHQLRVIKKVI
ncbi:NlpC/P60 family protein [Flagellimonas allohymeniacidonis]|uniref:Hydrolase Nlp/P60 n=1 Tax=Flagellimonas allohymeniacidonis TaxID=2517819 RepID=A0A4V2HSM6_9FLAO|nr:NlpC/P60 family protein [Allomuricauda hymeniacidonis]TAI48340.1 hydrolase Nlp/P60 [Allomuricauda hymeniacidonis]